VFYLVDGDLILWVFLLLFATSCLRRIWVNDVTRCRPIVLAVLMCHAVSPREWASWASEISRSADSEIKVKAV
jgi:hypothetical protein